LLSLDLNKEKDVAELKAAWADIFAQYYLFCIHVHEKGLRYIHHSLTSLTSSNEAWSGFQIFLSDDEYSFFKAESSSFLDQEKFEDFIMPFDFLQFHRSERGELKDPWKAEGRAGALHSVPNAFSGGVDYLLRFQDKELVGLNGDKKRFEVPPDLYAAAFECMVVARSKEEMEKSVVQLPGAERIVKQYGLCRSLIDEIASPGRVASHLAWHRLLQVTKPQAANLRSEVSIDVTGTISPEDCNLKVDMETRGLLAVLIILLKEAIQHTLLLWSEDPKLISSESRPQPLVKIDNENLQLSIMNPTQPKSRLIPRYSEQENTLNIFRHFLSNWKIEKVDYEKDSYNGYSTWSRTIKYIQKGRR